MSRRRLLATTGPVQDETVQLDVHRATITGHVHRATITGHVQRAGGNVRPQPCYLCGRVTDGPRRVVMREGKLLSRCETCDTPQSMPRPHRVRSIQTDV